MLLGGWLKILMSSLLKSAYFLCSDLDSQLIHGFLSPRESSPTPNGISVGSAMFVLLTRIHHARIVQLYLWGGPMSTPIFDMIPWAHPSLCPNQHIDQFSHSCRADICDQQTDRQTDMHTLRPLYSLWRNELHLAIATMQPSTCILYNSSVNTSLLICVIFLGIELSKVSYNVVEVDILMAIISLCKLP